jgi:GTP-binding protein HflX
VFDRSKRGEHAILIQPHFGRLEEDVLEEFTDLARSAGASIAATLTARIDRPNPSILIGSGKLDEVKAAADATGADLVPCGAAAPHGHAAGPRLDPPGASARWCHRPARPR